MIIAATNGLKAYPRKVNALDLRGDAVATEAPQSKVRMLINCFGPNIMMKTDYEEGFVEECVMADHPC